MQDDSLLTIVLLDNLDYILDLLACIRDDLNLTHVLLIVLEDGQAVLNQDYPPVVGLRVLLQELVIGEQFVLNPSNGMQRVNRRYYNRSAPIILWGKLSNLTVE